MVLTSMTNTAPQPSEPKGAKTPATPPTKARGGAASGRLNRGFKSYFKEVGREMKKVSWPTKQETNRLTGVVLAVCFIIGVLLTGLGFVAEMVVNLVTRGHI